jgi:hypothetical protein
MKLDVDARLWLYLRTKKVWRPGKKPNRAATTELFHPLFLPANLSNATPYTCFFLRFFDYSPTFPFRDMQSGFAVRTFVAVSLPYHSNLFQINL